MKRNFLVNASLKMTKWFLKNMEMTNATENVANGNILFMIASK